MSQPNQFGSPSSGGSHGLVGNYDVDDANPGSHLSNIQGFNPDKTMPGYKGNLGRKAAVMGNWENPTPGVGGTFFNQDDTTPTEMPHAIKAVSEGE